MPRRPLALPAALIGAVGLVATAAVIAVAPASAATVRPVAQVAAEQNTFDHGLVVHGWARDVNHPDAAISVRVYGNGHYLGKVRADRRATRTRHAFRLVVTTKRFVRSVVVRAASGSRVLDTARTSFVRPTAGQRIVSVARRYVGRARYVSGGTSPRTGFDCSGYARYVYQVARVARLPHNAEAQRHVKGLRRERAASARAGDLVFYLSGGSAYHVAIYAGHGMQYSAATEREGIRYQHIWATNVEYRHFPARH